MSGLQEIWNDGKGKLSEEKLHAYLSGTLSKEEEYEIELWLSEENMESDALEGLKQLPAEATYASVQRLNKQLRQLTHKRKRRSHLLKETKWAWLAVVIILMLTVMAYFLLHWTSK
ncbi:MAG TPA: hypothetical protein VL098_03370 [Flavipsychrobacter sp.]|nr:hypothetical protein [Flavipsychrobacter sp.]